MRQGGPAWDLRVFLGKDPVGGKQRHVTKTVRGGKREAKRVLNAMVVDAERGLIARTNTTVGELLDAWPSSTPASNVPAPKRSFQ